MTLGNGQFFNRVYHLFLPLTIAIVRFLFVVENSLVLAIGKNKVDWLQPCSQ